MTGVSFPFDNLFYSNLENLVLWARSETVGFAILEYKIDRIP
jgi:hypothetical protein